MTKTIVVTLSDDREDVLNKRVQLVTERIRSQMFGCDNPSSPDAWKFTINNQISCLVIMEGGICQEVLSYPYPIQEDVWDWDDFWDSPIECWDNRDDDQKAFIKTVMSDSAYQDIIDRYNEAKWDEEESKRAICFGDVPDTNKESL